MHFAICEKYLKYILYTKNLINKFLNLNYVRGLYLNPIIVKIINYSFSAFAEIYGFAGRKYNSQVTKYYNFYNKVGTSETTREINNNLSLKEIHIINVEPLISFLNNIYLILINKLYILYNKIFNNILLLNLSLNNNNKIISNNKLLLNSSLNNNNKTSNNIWFNQWLAGLIDGNGYFGISKKGYPSCEITMNINDEKTLKIIQNKLGGSIKLRSGVKTLRWRLTNKEGMINLINIINGNIRNNKRLPQLYKVCDIFNIKVINPISLNINNGWFVGFFDAKGIITYIIKNDKPQLTISVINKYLNDIQPYMDILGGNIYFDKGNNGYYKWTIQNKEDIIRLYKIFIKSKSYKLHRIHLIFEYFKLIDLKAYNSIDPATVDGGENNELLYKSWIYFNKKWYKGYNYNLKI